MGSIRPCLLIAAALTASLVATADAQSFNCTPAEWKTSNGILSCKTYGEKSSVIELADGGGFWTHAYQAVDVVPNAVYRISGDFYPLVRGGDCDATTQSPKVTWCSPSVAVCSGAYNGEPNPVKPPELQSPPFPGRLRRLRPAVSALLCSPHARTSTLSICARAAEYYAKGTCKSSAPTGQPANAWAPFNFTVTPVDLRVTLYINEEGSTYASVVNSLAMDQRMAPCPRLVLCSLLFFAVLRNSGMR